MASTIRDTIINDLLKAEPIKIKEEEEKVAFEELQRMMHILPSSDFAAYVAVAPGISNSMRTQLLKQSQDNARGVEGNAAAKELTSELELLGANPFRDDDSALQGRASGFQAAWYGVPGEDDSWINRQFRRLAGRDTQKALSSRANFSGKVFLEQFDKLKGAGAITEREGAIATMAANRLADEALNDESFLENGELMFRALDAPIKRFEAGVRVAPTGIEFRIDTSTGEYLGQVFTFYDNETGNLDIQEVIPGQPINFPDNVDEEKLRYDYQRLPRGQQYTFMRVNPQTGQRERVSGVRQ